MTLDELKAKLKELGKPGDPEGNHIEADAALLDYINDDEVSDLFREIRKWYG